DRHEVDERQGEPDHETGDEGIPARAVRHSEDDEDEHGGEDNLNTDRAAGAEASWGEFTPAIACEAAFPRAVEPATGRRADQGDDARPDRAAEDLGGDVSDRAAPREAPRRCKAERDRRIEVPTRDRPEGVDAGDD